MKSTDKEPIRIKLSELKPGDCIFTDDVTRPIEIIDEETDKEPTSICVKHNKRVCEECLKDGVWTFPESKPPVSEGWEIMFDKHFGSIHLEAFKGIRSYVHLRQTHWFNEIKEFIQSEITAAKRELFNELIEGKKQGPFPLPIEWIKKLKDDAKAELLESLKDLGKDWFVLPYEVFEKNIDNELNKLEGKE